MSIRMMDGREVFLQKRDSVISINGQFEINNLDEIVNKIKTGRWVEERSNHSVPIKPIHLGKMVVKSRDQSDIIKNLNWSLEKFSVMEIRGSNEDEKLEFMKCIGFEARNASNVFLIDSNGSALDLPMRQWNFMSGKPYGLDLFTPYGGAMKSRDEANKEKTLTVEAIRGALDISGKQLLLLKEALDKLFDNYWYQVSLGSKGYPKTPSIKLVLDYLSKQGGGSVIGLMTKLHDLKSYSQVFDAPLPSQHSTGVYSYSVLPPKIRNLTSFQLMRKLAKAKEDRLLIFNYEDLPTYKIERKYDLFGSIMEDVQSNNLSICYTLHQMSPTPKWITENYPGKILKVQLTSDVKDEGFMPIPKKKGYAFVRGSKKSATLIQWESLKDRIHLQREDIIKEQSIIASQMQDLED